MFFLGLPHLILAALLAGNARALPTSELAHAPVKHKYVPYHRPTLCLKSNVYCLTVETDQDGGGVDWTAKEGTISWTHQKDGDPWVTYGEFYVRKAS